MKPVLAFPVYDRPHYVALTLDSWRQVRGIETAHTVYRCEPGEPLMERLVRRDRPPCPGEVTVNEKRLGNDQNMKAAIGQAFATGAEFVIAAEDDVLVSADLIEYMMAMADFYAGDSSVLAVTAWQDGPPGPAGRSTAGGVVLGRGVLGHVVRPLGPGERQLAAVRPGL